MKFFLQTTLVATLAASALTARGGEILFNRDIRPVLSDKCFHCHGPDEEARKAKLRLDLFDGEQGASQAINPGDLKGSEIWHRVTSDDPDEVMPPADSHTEALTAEERQLMKRWIEGGAEYQDFWAFVPPRNFEAPAVDNPAWAKTPIDRFVLDRMESASLSPKPGADRRTLVRRLSFDLTGLPPTVEEIDKFVGDSSPDSYEQLVDRLIAKPQYGEHMAKYWLDLVRFADTNGMHHDHFRDMSPYRDWVIRSFNSNLPFSQFVIDQLAGDLHADPSTDQLVASGFNRLHLIIDRGTALPEESFAKNVIDRVSAVGTAFMGLTLQCAVCHDHKYDPITQRDFYQMYAFFNSFDGDPETGGRRGDDFKRGLQKPYIDLPDGSAAMVMKERADPRPAHILVRGAYDNPGEQVGRNTPGFLPPLENQGEEKTRMDLAQWMVAPSNPLTARVAVNRFWQQFFGVGLVKTSEDFGAQGEWPSHPELLDHLTLRFVESGWDVKALVRDIVHTRTYRQTSKAPRQEYVDDPDNRLLARGSRFRLDSEMVRDQVLASTGLLNTSLFGKSVKPPQPEGLWKIVAMPSSYPNAYKADTGENVYRRSIYTFWKRGLPPPQMTIFDAPERTACIARRERTNTPLQALLLMNEEQYFEAAKHLARQLYQGGGEEGAMLTLAYETITSRELDEVVESKMLGALETFKAQYRDDDDAAKALLPDITERAERIDLAALTMIVHSLLNLDTTKTRE